jgi:uncharacterized protein (DUF983 family)
MTVAVLRVLCANCRGDELLSQLVVGATACRWCGLSYQDDLAPAGESRRILLPVVLVEEEFTAPMVERWEERAR